MGTRCMSVLPLRHSFQEPRGVHGPCEEGVETGALQAPSMVNRIKVAQTDQQSPGPPRLATNALSYQVSATAVQFNGENAHFRLELVCKPDGVGSVAGDNNGMPFKNHHHGQGLRRVDVLVRDEYSKGFALRRQVVGR